MIAPPPGSQTDILPPVGESSRKWVDRGAPFLLVGLVALAFANALPEGFVYDGSIIQDHEALKPDAPWWLAWARTYWGSFHSGGLYRPLTIFSYWIERRLLGFEAAWPHATVNMLLHAAATLLVWRLARRWGVGAGGALAGAALFAAHPIATEVVPNLVGRSDLLATIGVVGALLCWERVGGPRARVSAAWIAAAAGLWLLGLLSKESAVAMPAIAGLRDVWRASEGFINDGDGPLQRFWRGFIEALRRWWPRYAVLALVGIAWLALYVAVTSAGPPKWTSMVANPLIESSTGERWPTVVYVWGRYLLLAAWPAHVSADYSYAAIEPIASPLDPAYLFALGASLAYVVAMLGLWRAKPAAAMGLVFAALAILPVSNLLFPIGTVMAVRLMYLPLAGLAVAAGAGVDAALGRVTKPAGRVAIAAAMLVAVAALGWRTHERNEAWRTHRGLFEQTVRDVPRSAKALHAMARLHRDAGEWDAAIRDIDAALRIIEDLPPAHTVEILLDASGLHVDRGEALVNDPATRGEAIRHLELAVDLAARVLRAFREPGARRDFQAAAAEYLAERAPGYKLDEAEVRALSNLGKALYLLRRWAPAAEVFAEAVERRPKDTALISMLARSLANAGELQRSAAVLRQAAAAHPEDERIAGDLARVEELIAERSGPVPEDR